jgi:hypothetical protein
VLDAGRIGELVRERFEVDYTLAGLDVLLHRIGWSVQVPARRAAERDKDQIARWREETWPVIKGRRRTWAPIQRAILGKVADLLSAARRPG